MPCAPRTCRPRPTTLKLVGQAPAGGSYDHALKPGETVRIFTGGPLPMGADAIVIQEDTKADGDQDHHPRGAAHRPPHPQGRARLQRPATGRCAAGRTLTTRDVALAAAMNLPWLSVHRKPRVAILSTGDELVMPGEPVGRNQIVSSSGIAVAALVRAWGGEPTLFDIARDDASADPGPHRRRRPARPPDHPGRRLGRRPRPRPGRAQGAGLRHGFLAHRHAPGQAADVRRQGPRPRARPAGQSGLDHGLRAPVPEARDGPHAGPARRPGRRPSRRGSPST